MLWDAAGKLGRQGKGRSSREPREAWLCATSDWDSKVTPGLHPRVIYYFPSIVVSKVTISRRDHPLVSLSSTARYNGEVPISLGVWKPHRWLP